MVRKRWARSSAGFVNCELRHGTALRPSAGYVIPKDWWDKAQAVGALLSGIAVPLVVFVAAEKADDLQKPMPARASVS